MALFADNHDGFVLPNARFNPTATSGSGLLTPPESPRSGYAELPTSAQCHAPVTDEHQELPPSYRWGRPEPEKQSVQPDLSGVSETIYTIIEQVIEQKLAEAMGPLRLNIRRFDSENTDLQTQNDRLEQQLRTLQNLSVTVSNNVEMLSSIASQLSYTVNAEQRSNSYQAPQPFSGAAPSPSAWQQQERHDSIQPQFCFESRSPKRHRPSNIKSRKPRLVKYMLSKWRTEGGRA